MGYTDADGDANVAPGTSSTSSLSALNPKRYVDGTNLLGWDLALVIFGGLLTATGVGFSAIVGAVMSALALLPRGFANWILAVGLGLGQFLVTFATSVWSAGTGALGIVPGLFEPIVAIAVMLVVLYIVNRGVRA